jgi:hypothetical protein
MIIYHPHWLYSVESLEAALSSIEDKSENFVDKLRKSTQSEYSALGPKFEPGTSGI